MNDTTPLHLIATAAGGLEACAKRELEALGFDGVGVHSPGRIGFHTPPAGVARANLWLRTADRVLLVVGEVEAGDFDALFDGARALAWDRWIPADGAFPVRGRSVKSRLASAPACQKTVKKAIVERLRAAHGVRDLPETGPTCRVEVALRNDRALLTLDTTGAGLHKRGYRAAAGPAPLKETLAAAMIRLSFWTPDRPLVDPFCGSGTIPIEAALIGRTIAPGLRRTFDAEQWPALPAALWDAERARARAAIAPALPVRIIGTDIEPKAVSLARHHAELAGVADDIHIQAQPFDQLTSKRPYGCVICNPPYGRRFERSGAVDAVYRAMPEVFRRLKTWSFYVLTSVDLEAVLGQEADRRRKLYNGRIACTYYQFHGPRPPREGERREERPPAAAFGGLKAHATHQAEVFANRLRKMARHRRRWPNRGITCYRLYDRDIPEVPLAVDRYEEYVHVAEYERPHDRTPAEHADWLDMLMDVIAEVLEVPREHVFLKHRRRQRGSAQYERVAERGRIVTVHEGGLTFEVNLSDYLDTGLFLDHRLTRARVREEAAGKRMVNLFAYTGAFSVYAAAGGAASTTTVDLSKTYLDWARRNMALNGVSPGPAHRFVQADAMAFLADHAPGDHYDLAVIDPPTFSNSKRTEGVFDVQRDHAPLLAAAARLMPPGGVIYFSTNARRFKLDEPALPGLEIQDITRRTVPDDFRNARVHRCWRMVVV
ncbi:MAG: bifunctional 23S rRNA (guanine(2069)-N(7))-methyltransferase RlmK/23S rRNA (guanine(2445)-N(2))-methyltransferase RlmL [Planctomycetota bacterium]